MTTDTETLRKLPRATGDDAQAGWKLPFAELEAIRGAAGEWGEQASLEATEAIALEVEARILAALTPSPEAQDWQGISTAPYDTAVTVRVGDMTFRAILKASASITEDGGDCDQWQAVNEGEHPPCWSAGACWDSNEDGIPSLQPTHWRALSSEAPAAQEQPVTDRFTDFAFRVIYQVAHNLEVDANDLIAAIHYLPEHLEEEIYRPSSQPEVLPVQEQLKVMREALERLDKLTDEAPFDFGLIRLIVRQALAVTAAQEGS